MAVAEVDEPEEQDSKPEVQVAEELEPPAVVGGNSDEYEISRHFGALPKISF